MKIFSCFLSFLLVVPVAWSKPVAGLYDSKVPVPNQQVQSRQQGAKVGLLEVLQKVSGFSIPADNEAIKRALGIADQYLYQFSYEAVEKDEWDETIPPGSSWLNMRFEGQAIQRIVQQADLPLWGGNRPTVLLWAMIDENARRVIIDGEQSLISDAIAAASYKRGVPLVLPLYDLEDSIRLPQESLWGLFAEPIKEASTRYEADSVAAVRLYKNADDRWVGQWRFYFREREYRYEFESDSVKEQMLLGVSASAEVLANAYAIRPSLAQSDLIAVKILGIADLNRYASVLKYLEKLSVTKDVVVNSVQGDTLALSVTLNGTIAQFNQVLKLDKKLNQIEVEAAEVVSDLAPLRAESLQFSWQP
ncbi:hypothetical protein NBRC116188_02420 [Oceaniserpentilla sp. 4NH20-0058]|uniref:DUF2066 domain-containing protein n=1 Tax=Oceaniserpentilla sp. 4NH20-0058 TaxID=3127660 RepID=UPI00310BC069